MDSQQDLPERLRQFYNLEPLPVEGGLFKQTYRSMERIEQGCLPGRYSESRPLGTAIIYLLNTDPDSFSAMHSLPTDEIYHFYMGDPVEMLLLYPEGHSERILLGHDVFAGQKVQFVVPRGVWQGSHLMNGGKYALIGTTMAPGYVDSDYIGGTREDLTRLYPQEANLIQRLTRLPG
jgi:predicted cupin superfamily sugar epimerase